MKLLAVSVALLAVAGCKKKRVESSPVAEEKPADPRPRTDPNNPWPETLPTPPPSAAPDPWLDAPRVEPPVAAVEPPKPVDPNATAEAGTPLPTYTGSVAVDRLLADARTYLDASAPDTVVQGFRANYVRRDGTLDPKYGELHLEIGAPDHPAGMVDDPDRPTGAPIDIKAKPRTKCPRLTFSNGEWVASSMYGDCYKHAALRPEACTTVAIWDRAIADQAPANAVAVIERSRTSNSSPSWSFRVSDKLRDVEFRRSYADDCNQKPAKPAAKPAAKP